jgi:cell division protein FtsL
MLRLLHCLMVMGLIASAGYVYDIKYRATGEAQQAQRLRIEIRAEKDRIATARAEWGKLASPDRIQDLATRHLKMKSIEPSRFGSIANLPMRPKAGDPIRDILQSLPPETQVNNQSEPDETATGSVGEQ